jgi:sugar lactone lactonase YvrE
MSRGASAAAAAAVLLVACGGRARLDDRTGPPIVPGSAIETVIDLDYPPGNIAVSATGRVFFTLHPDGTPPFAVHELRDGRAVPYPSAEFHDYQTPLALRIDRQNRLWVLDYAGYGRGQPRLLAFDLATDREVIRYDFPSDVAGFLSMLNDFQVDPAGEHVYIAEASPIRQTPALVVFDVVHRRSRRLLASHPSLLPAGYVIQAPGRDMVVLGLYALHIGVDTIALDRSGEWLYYGAVNADRLYRIRTRDLDDESLAPAALAARIEDYGPKPLSDGASSDDAGRVYLTDMEHSAVLALGPDRRLQTVVKDARLRWPDGLSFGPDGWLYVTCSALHDVLFVSSATMRAHAPYQIYRFRPGATAAPGS